MATDLMSPDPRKHFFGIMVPVLVIGVLADQASKSWASLQAIEPHLLVPGYLAAYLVPNPGAILGFGGDRAWSSTALVLLGAACTVLLAGLSRRDRVPWRGADCLASSLFLAGILGNNIDRVALGYVRDFLVAWAVPTVVFNVADLFVAVGSVSLLIARYSSIRRFRTALVVSA
jgi:signal peptidase II